MASERDHRWALMGRPAPPQPLTPDEKAWVLELLSPEPGVGIGASAVAKLKRLLEDC